MEDSYYKESPMETVKLIYENGRPITVVAPLAIVTIYYFFYIPEITIYYIINYIMLIFGVTFLRMGINNVNNSYDVEVDRINKPHRPIPRGDLMLESAFIIGAIMQFIALFVFMLLSTEAFLLCLSFVILGWLYNIDKGLKNYFPINNLIIGYVRGFGYLLAIYVASIPEDRSQYTGSLVNSNHILFAIAITLYIFGSVNSKDIKDVEGDKKENRQTLPIILGEKNQFLALISAPFILSPLVIAGIMVWMNIWSTPFLLLFIILPFDMAIIYYLNKASTNPLTENTTAWFVMIITYLSHHIIFTIILSLIR